MDGEDVMEVEVYNERKEHWKGRSVKREKRNRRKNIGRRKWTVPLFIQTQSSREHLYRALYSFDSESEHNSFL